MKIIGSILAALTVLLLVGPSSGQSRDLAEIERISKSGATLEAEVARKFPLHQQSVDDDTGINVLIDLSHQANFFAMWRLPRMLRSAGFRATGSQASLDSVLVEGKFSRVRIPLGRRRPFAWWPNARYNAVITFQKDPRAQEYLPQEVAAMKRYVDSGGGLVLLGGTRSRLKELEQWPLNKLAKQFGAAFSTESDTVDGVRMPVLKISSDWESHLSGTQGKPLIARRQYTMDETVEDMSIAVGEDLFGFFRKIGTTLDKERFACTLFDGETIELPVAPLDISPAGPVRLEPVGDYRKPLVFDSKR